MPNTGMVITRDITTDLADIHPKNKKDVGLRLAALALHNTYGKTDVVANGPTFKSLRIDGDKAIVTFDHTNGGLTTKDGKAPDWFTIAGEDGNFVKADAAITGPSEITVSSPSVKTPVAVRFAWDQIATPNLHNGAGFPADAFRTDHTVLKSLALNKPVTASHDAQADFVPENIVDGDADNSSSWRCPISPAWIQVDLGDVHQIDEVKVFPYYDGQRHYQYTVETSTDGKTWNEVVDMTNATAPETAAGHDHHLDATPARYVRVNMIKNSANPAVHLNELLVFGK
jgi:sialate O-acetylesterase